MELNVSIPDSLFERIDDRVDDESFASRREFVESALEYFLHARERAEYLSQKLPTEMTDRERAEHQAYLCSLEAVSKRRG